MQQVNSLADLKHERKRLLQRSRELEHLMRQDLKGLKQEIDQSHLFSKVVRKLISGKDEGIYIGTGILTDFLIKRIFFRRAGFLTKQAMSSLAQNITQEVITEKKDVVLSWLGNIWNKISERKPFYHLFDGHPKKKTAQRRRAGIKKHSAHR